MRRRRQRLLAVTALVALALGAYVLLQRSATNAASDTANGAVPSVRAYLVATGVFAQPAAGQGPAPYLAAEQAAADAKSAVAYAAYVDQESFETTGWRDLLEVGRMPIGRPPKIDFMREVAVLIWPVAGKAPATTLRASGLTLEHATLQHVAVEIDVQPAPAGQPIPTPVGATATLPYALVTIPRDQWPIPAPPPTVPPITVVLGR